MIGGVVLAGGRGERFGDDDKVLAVVDNTPLVGHVVARLSAGGVAPIVVVTRVDLVGEIRALLGASETTVVVAVPPGGGIGDSLRVGVAALPEDCPAFVVALGDQPYIQPEVVRTLAETWEQSIAAAVVPSYRNADWGHPVVMDATLRKQLGQLSGDVGARALLQSLGDRVVRVAVDAPAPRDVDTPKDLDELRSSATS